MKRVAVAVGILGVVAFLVLAPPITQEQAYHSFADQRTILGIPNFWNVASNLAFVVAGIAGWFMVRGLAASLLALGVFLTCFGSSYYHLSPDDARLVWDRLPMAIVFMSLVAILLSERLLAPLVALGIASVWWWHRTGNLNPYILVQFGSMLVLLVAAIVRKDLRGLWPVFALYVLAKIAEALDGPIYAILPLSGHTAKHLLAGAASFKLCSFLRLRPHRT